MDEQELKVTYNRLKDDEKQLAEDFKTRDLMTARLNERSNELAEKQRAISGMLVAYHGWYRVNDDDDRVAISPAHMICAKVHEHRRLGERIESDPYTKLGDGAICRIVLIRECPEFRHNDTVAAFVDVAPGLLKLPMSELGKLIYGELSQMVETAMEKRRQKELGAAVEEAKHAPINQPASTAPRYCNVILNEFVNNATPKGRSDG